MTYQEIREYVEIFNENKLVNLCNEIYDWYYVKGFIDSESELKKLSKLYGCEDKVRFLADIIIEETAKRLNKTVPLLLMIQPQEFLKKVE